MKSLLLRALILLLSIISPGILFAQQSNDYSLLLNSGTVTPIENAQTVTKNQEVFKNSLFNGKHYVILQFKAIPTQAVKNQVSQQGIQLIDYLPNKAYTATISVGFNLTAFKLLPLRSVFLLTPEQKTVSVILQGNVPAHAVNVPGYADVNVITYEKLDRNLIAKDLIRLKATILEDMPMFRTFTLRVPQNQLVNLVKLPFVQWVEPIDAPNAQENLPGRTLHRANILNDGVRNLKGDGVDVGIWDSGEVSPHVDFSPLPARLHQMEISSASSHSTHCAGTIAGRGIINPDARGMAPNAELFSYNFNGNITSEMATAIPNLGLEISSHSYGSTQTCGVTGAGVAYSSTSRSTDINLNTYPDHLHVHSAGNSQTACSGGWSTITGSGKTAKNNILVANITSTEVISGSSSFGPVADGRVKPEISAMGTNVLSTYTPLNTYATASGTSMATPGVAGTLALLVQRYKQLNGNVNPISSLIKATVCNNAADLGNAGPDYKFGFGRINALEAVKALEQNRYQVNTIATGATNDITITVPSGTVKLKVMLTWNDPAGTANANPALVNNLDLKVLNGASTTLPWILNPLSPNTPATRAIDNVSNIEQVTLDNPAAGTYTLRVNGTAVPVGAGQQYSLTWTIDQPFIEVIYPNGGESLTPGSVETITWDRAGVTGNQTVQYSLNNGATWVTISTSVPASTTRYNWTIPAGTNTSTALVRVFSGFLSDDSDDNFQILGSVNNLTASNGVCAGSLNFSWTAVANATHYDLFRLDNTTGEWIILAANITGTTYAATGLTPNANMWFTISARNNTLGSVSEKAIAINKTVPGGGTPVSLGPVAGWQTICGATQNVTYSVTAASGINSYTWTVPAGAVISSGQGTNSIIVNYPASATNGSVSVTGSTNGCLTNPSTLAIYINPALPTAVSGGDQTGCSGQLTATATVPTGYTTVWYTAASGGTIVTNPSLTTAGTITYYAATKSLNGNCESTTRTAVNLTLTTAPPVSVTASGPTTICQGSTVTLTASAGNAYLWSNGQTTQSITVTTPGSYSVKVSSNGCDINSQVITVNVVAPPSAAITASGPTTFCQGGQVVLTTGLADNYLWSNGETTQSIIVNSSGNYSVTVSNSSGCSETSSPTSVRVNPIPAANISASGPTSFCQGGQVTLTASAGANYVWSNGATSQSITVSDPGNYSVSVTNNSGCSETSAAVPVTVSPKPTVILTAAPYQNLMPGLSTTLKANVSTSTNNVAYTWFKNGLVLTGATAATLPVTLDERGDYTVMATLNGCSATSNIVTVADSASTEFFIYPNPNTGVFQIRYYNPTGTITKNSVFIYDAKGARISQEDYHLHMAYEKMEVDMRSKSQGMYLVVIHDSNGKKLASGRVVVLPK